MNYRTISYGECFSTEMKSLGIVNVTPEVAAQLLEKNNKDEKSSNRRVSRSNVEKYKRCIETNHWQVSLEHMISIASDNRLNNGQHRLIACVETNTPILVHVCVGCSPSARTADVAGLPRTQDDLNRLAGNPLVGKKLQIARSLIKYDNGSKSAYVPTDFEIEETFQKYKDGIEKVVSILNSRIDYLDEQVPKQSLSPHVRRVGFLAGATRAICSNPDKGEQFARIIIEQRTNSQPSGCPTRFLDDAFLKACNEDRSNPKNDHKNTMAAFEDFVNGVNRKRAYRVAKKSKQKLLNYFQATA